MVYIFLAEGFEEIEALSPVDILRRGGAEVTTVGVGGKVISGSHNIPVTADITLEETDCTDAEMLILPGGLPGTTNLEASDKLKDILDKANKEGKYIAAICAAPSVLGKRGMLKGRKATCYPGYEEEMLGAKCVGTPVEVDGSFITAKGAGAASEFAFALLSALKGSEVSDKIRGAMQY